jgi:hypothetical protein
MSETKFELGPLQKQWIAALRSGEYQQGIKCLKKDKYVEETLNEVCYTYCCLGVANEVLELKEFSSEYLFNTYKKLGLYDHCGSIAPFISIYGSLTEMNDSCEYTFSQIADFIEKNAQHIFTESK